MLEVINPANGEAIAELATDSPETVAAKYAAARAAQPAWAAVPLEHRIEMLAAVPRGAGRRRSTSSRRS